MKVLAFGATNSRQSINKQLAKYAASLTGSTQIELIDLNDYEMAIYSIDKENENGIPEKAKNFIRKIADADVVIVSFAEYNGVYTSAFKNVYDWASRVEHKIFQSKPAVFLSTSPGGAGAKSVLNFAVESAKYMGADLKASLSVANFYNVFDEKNSRINDPAINAQLKHAISTLNLF
ncbi:NADPH-dependent FMN reductase [Veronia nyctiphanis]|uniref:NADPH-dependent FMN reductase n=1 Tax=Veronia nyctiphanis TaxID=1278244 RepID=A0A4Q0YW41_9GAMM|nr:NAD(P)H-dependent oxidoreductase [Veronia nyctiphanis]RXJ74464.1 NADPH-dependent FMN reductase [Veronia nyctiphanis]